MLGLFGLLGLHSPAWAQQDMQVRAAVTPSNVMLGEIGQYQILLSNIPAEPENVEPPTVDGFEFGPMQQQRYQSTNVVNRFGQMQTQSQLQLSLVWNFRASKPGTYTIPGQVITIRGVDYKLEDKTVTVGQPSRDFLDTVSLRLGLPEGPVYVGQLLPIRVILRIRRDADVAAQRGAVLQRLGDDMQEVFAGAQPQQNDVTEAGVRYAEFSWAYILSPTRAGPHELNFSFPIDYGDPRLGRYRSITLFTDHEPIRVSALPEQGRPASFTGGVGQFSVDHEWSREEVTTGEPVELTLTVNGRGNISRMEAPQLKVPENWRAYPPRVDQTEGDTPLRGTKTISYVLIPESSSVTETPEVRLAWFDPAKSAYQEEVVAPQPLKVTGEAAAPAPRSSGGSTLRSPSGPGIGALATAPGSFYPDNKPLFYRPMFWAGNVGFALVLGLLGYVRWKRLRYETEPELRARATHTRAIEQSLSTARQAAAKQESVAFYQASFKALQIACAGPGVPAESVTLEQIDQRLAKAGMPEDDRRSLVSLLNRGDALRYGGRAQQTDFSADLKRVEHAVRQLQA